MILFCALTFCAVSQPILKDYEIQPGPFFKVNKRSVPVDFVGYDQNGFYLAYAKGKNGSGELSLATFGYDLALEQEVKLISKIESIWSAPERLFFLDGDLYLVATTEFGAEKRIYLQRIDKTALQLEEAKPIAKVSGGVYGSTSVDIRITFSSDSSHFAIVYAIPGKRKDRESLGVKVLNRSLEEVWSKEFELPYTNKLLDLSTYRISNDGKLYMLGKRYFDKRRNKLAGAVNYDYLVLSMDRSGLLDSVKIAAEGRFLKDMQFDISDTNELICAGFYSEKASTSVGGAYYLKVDGETEEVLKGSFQEFEEGFLLQNMSENKAKRIKKKIDKGKEVELPFFYIDDFLIDEDGSIKIIAEQRHIYTITIYTQYGVTSTTHFDYDDIMLLEIDPNGEFSSTVRIAKRQHTVNDRAVFSSYSSAVNNENTYFIFNDNAQNVNYNGVGNAAPMQKNSTTMVMVARVDEEGNIVRDALFNRGDVETKVRPALCVQLNEKEMLLFGHRGLKTQRFFILRFK
ncbi:MAG: hypothetical protein AAF789_04105 [Bacteroidota bacterium]